MKGLMLSWLRRRRSPDLESPSLLLLLLTSRLRYPRFNLWGFYVIDVLKAGAVLYFTYINFQRVWISCFTWMLNPNGLNDTCLCVFVNLYLANLEEPPANAAANGWSNDCCKWNCRILFLQSEKIKTAAFTGCDTLVCEPSISAWWIFQTWINQVCNSFIFSPNGFSMGSKHYKNYCGNRWRQQLSYFIIFNHRLTYVTQDFTKFHPVCIMLILSTHF